MEIERRKKKEERIRTRLLALGLLHFPFSISHFPFPLALCAELWVKFM